jgi:hypothetical protein
MSDEPKEDFLHHCNNMGVPIPDFTAAFCVRCLQPQCQRSAAGRSLFDIRTKSWEERLFRHPTIMLPDDPRYPKIAAQKFSDIGPQSKFMPEVGSSEPTSWMDPRDLDDVSPSPDLTPRPQQVPPQRALAPEPLSEPAPSTEPQRAEPEPQRPAPTPAARRGPLQTPFQQGKMLEGAPLPPKPAPKDSWASTPAETSTAPILQPGAKFRFGKS